MFDEKFDVEEKMKAGNAFAKAGDGELGRGRVVHLEAQKCPRSTRCVCSR